MLKLVKVVRLLPCRALSLIEESMVGVHFSHQGINKLQFSFALCCLSPQGKHQLHAALSMELYTLPGMT